METTIKILGKTFNITMFIWTLMLLVTSLSIVFDVEESINCIVILMGLLSFASFQATILFICEFIQIGRN